MGLKRDEYWAIEDDKGRLITATIAGKRPILTDIMRIARRWRRKGEQIVKVKIVKVEA